MLTVSYPFLAPLVFSPEFFDALTEKSNQLSLDEPLPFQLLYSLAEQFDFFLLIADRPNFCSENFHDGFSILYEIIA